MGVFDSIKALHKHLYLDSADPRILDWPLVSTYKLNLSIVLSYFVFVTFLGPRLMKNRKPFDLRGTMIVYNIALVIVNFKIFWELFKLRMFGSPHVGCLTLASTANDDAETFKMVELLWWFCLTKYIELSDTVFFVLRKKENQLSKLHLIHHTGIPLVTWILLRFEPGGYNTFFPTANAFVHCIMYSYYTLAAFGDDMQQNLWFKKYITMTQLMQFVFVLTFFFTRPLFGCKVSMLSMFFNTLLAGFFFVLFCNFYYHAYIKNLEDKSDVDNAGSSRSNGTVKNKNL